MKLTTFLPFATDIERSSDGCFWVALPMPRSFQAYLLRWGFFVGVAVRCEWSVAIGAIIDECCFTI